MKDFDARGVSGRLAELQRSFDLGFASPPRSLFEDLEIFLAIRIGGEPFALRLSELSGLQLRRKVVPLPDSVPGLLGVAGIRGQVVPIYSLEAMLGYPDADRDWRWLVLVGAETPLGLSLSDYEGHLQVPKRELHVVSEAMEEGSAVGEILRIGGSIRAVIRIPAIVEEIRLRAGLEGGE